MQVHSQLLNEIMPMIYKRFTDKAAEEWRQIYKVCKPVRFLEGASDTASRLSNFSSS